MRDRRAASASPTQGLLTPTGFRRTNVALALAAVAGVAVVDAVCAKALGGTSAGPIARSEIIAAEATSRSRQRRCAGLHGVSRFRRTCVRRNQCARLRAKRPRTDRSWNIGELENIDQPSPDRPGRKH